MRRFKNILLVCDEGSINEAVIDRAARLAKANEARLTLVDFIEAAPGELARMFAALPGVRAHDVEHEVLAFHRARLATLAERVRAQDVDTREHLVQGIGFVEVIRKVLRDRHDLVIKGAGGRDEGQSLFFASNDLHLLRKCPCPVWIMKKAEPRPFRRILAAVDPQPDDPQRTALNKLTIQLATSLATDNEGEVYVVHAWKLEEEMTIRGSPFLRVAEKQIDALLNEQRRQRGWALNQLLSECPATEAKRKVYLIKGAAREVVPDFAKRHDVELIVMGTVGRTGVSGLFIGNTAEAILNQVECSVLAVKPPGFKTPVALESSAQTGAKPGEHAA
ncbi:MAG: universal stress protein [Geminicoccaceae bacterium]